MALDQQRNWTISMAENLEAVLRKHKTTHQPERSSRLPRPQMTDEPKTHSYTPSSPVYLPDEIIIQILEHVNSQSTLAACCLLSRQWYAATLPYLYAHPHLYGANFTPFAAAICPSINLHVRKSPLASLVKTLDMSKLVHQAGKSLTARILGRTKGSLEEFIAPQASFAVVCLPPLSKCLRMRVLDLSLVSESPPLPELFKALSHLSELRTFRMPRSTGFGVHYKPNAFSWPPKLEEVCLSGGIDEHFLRGVVRFPSTLRKLSIEHCPQAKGYAVTHFLRTAVRLLSNLESLTIKHMPRLSAHALDDILFLLPQISTLSVSVDYITPAIFDEAHFHHLRHTPILPHTSHNFPPNTTFTEEEQDLPMTPLRHENLRTLELTNSGNQGIEDKISPIDILIAIDEGTIPAMRQVRVARSLLWQAGKIKEDSEALADVLQEKWGEESRAVGVFMFEG